jgi:putative MATE family efflux protein
MKSSNKSSERAYNIQNAPVLKTLINLSLPMTIAFLTYTLYQLVDMLYVARLGKEYIAAMTLTFIPNHFLYAVFIGPSIGVSSLTARYIGEKNYATAADTSNNSITIAFFLSVFFTILGLLYGKNILALLGGKGRVLSLAWDYFRIQIFFLSAVGIRIIYAGTLRGEGDTKTVMYSLGVSALINIVLDPLFIYGFWFIPRMEIIGASIATAISNLFSFVYIIFHVFKSKNIVKITLKKIHLNFKLILNIYKVGLPVMMQQLAMVLAISFISKLVASYGDYALASMGIGMRLFSLAEIPILGVSAGILTMVGQNYGAKKFDRVKKIIISGIFLNILIGTFIGIILMIFPGTIVSMFNNDENLVSFTKNFIYIMAPVFWGMAIGISVSHFFQGLGKAFTVLFLTALRVGLLSTPGAYILSAYLGLSGVWLGMASGTILTVFISLTLAVYYFKKKVFQESLRNETVLNSKTTGY